MPGVKFDADALKVFKDNFLDIIRIQGVNMAAEATSFPTHAEVIKQLQGLVDRFPDTSAAKDAQRRLDLINEGRFAEANGVIVTTSTKGKAAPTSNTTPVVTSASTPTSLSTPAPMPVSTPTPTQTAVKPAGKGSSGMMMILELVAVLFVVGGGVWYIKRRR
jgi:hypothetical protein